MAFLNETGLQHYQEAIRPMLVKGYTQEEYNVLSEEEKRGLAVITDAEPEGGGSGGACEEVYSTEETRIGRWIDGKPIYRMVVTTTVKYSLQGTTQGNGLTGADMPVRFSM